MARWCLLKPAKLKRAWGLNDHVPGAAEPTPHVFPILHGPPVLSGFLLCRRFTRYLASTASVVSGLVRCLLRGGGPGAGGEPPPLPVPPWAAEHPVSSRQSWGLRVRHAWAHSRAVCLLLIIGFWQITSLFWAAVFTFEK